ncbi:hypothetical protein PVAP13_1KG174431 [Panicum virgatum]|uniref:KIB1-4 beta-propeller domain-containing protein n=1 Tax=Panicum virgatum TaxID=38727 RepID=A0A8T0XE69_PANVG|nr:hypothetical protein PVAP13_1KG174431 [Panicum virgatum]
MKGGCGDVGRVGKDDGESTDLGLVLMGCPLGPLIIWSELSPDLLRDISARLHAAVDFVRFHAVCRPWRETAVDGAPGFLPWLLAPSGAHVTSADDLTVQRCRCVFSGTSCSAPGICIRDRRVACADGTAAWLVGGNWERRLVNPLTAAHLPSSSLLRCTPRHRMPDRTHRVVSGDGTILVYDFAPHPPGRADFRFVGEDFMGAIMCPDKDCPDLEPWKGVSGDPGTDRSLPESSNSPGCCAAIYNRGTVVCADLANYYILWQTVHCNSSTGRHVRMKMTARTGLPDEPGKIRRCSYLLESRGGDEHELLLASVLQEACGDLSVSLHALERKGDLPLVEWTRRDDDISMLRDDVLFLGFPGSFAVDASRFGGQVTGGTAYFIMDNSGGQTEEPCRVYSSGSSRRGQELKIYAGDLSLKHGTVAGARVAYEKRGRSRGFGFVNMATPQEGFDNAMAALNAVDRRSHARQCD